MTYADFYLVLLEAEARAADMTLPEAVRARSAETAGFVHERMAMEGLTRESLAELAKGDGSFILTPRKRTPSKASKRATTTSN